MESLNEKLNYLANDLVHACIKKNLKLVFAESMTGGLLASQVTSIPDASKILSESFIVYSDKAKENILNCQSKTIETYTVYSKEVIIEMLDGLKKLSNADIFVAVSGIAGPKTYKGIEVGTVYIGIQIHNKRMIFKEKFNGNRTSNLYQTGEFIFKTIINNI